MSALPRAREIGAQGQAALGLVSYFGAYLASVLTSLGILWLDDRANAALFVVVAVFVAIVVAIPTGVLWMKQWAHCLPANWVRQLPGGALVELVILEVAVFALDSLGLPTLEDKIVQGAVAELLSAVYEADFLGFSYRFRPGRTRICIKSFQSSYCIFWGNYPSPGHGQFAISRMPACTASPRQA